MKNKIKNFIQKNMKLLLDFISNNKQFDAFVILSLIETSFLRLFTLGLYIGSIKAFLFDFAMIILIGSFGYLFNSKKQYIYFQIILSILTFICIVNAIYYSWYNSYVTISLIKSLGQVQTVTDAVFDKLTPLQFIYIIFPVFMKLGNIYLKKHNYFDALEKSKKLFKKLIITGLILLFCNALTLTLSDLSRLAKQWNREYIVERYGIIIYQINDIMQSSHSELSSYFGYDNAAQKFISYYTEKNKNEKHNENEYTNIYKGKNLVFVHMESMMSMFINMEINGEEVTPNLNKLASEGMYFSNFYPEISIGTSSDSEFTLNTSLMPAQSGTVFVSYADRNYLSIEKLLNEQGYYTFSMHANSSSMWNRNTMHKNLGYQDFYSKEYFNVTNENTIGLGLSDHDFFEQMIPYLKTIESEHYKYMGTIITLTNHTPWNGKEAYGDFKLTATVKRKNSKTGEIETIEDDYLQGTKIGEYIRSVHYADKCLGEFISYLYENDLFDNTVLVFYGDHDSKLDLSEYNYLYNYDLTTGMLKEEGDEGYIDYDYYANELNRKTPLIIWTKNETISKEVSYYMGMIDVLPTVGNMFGFSSKYALGHDIFDIKDDNIITFPNGNFLTSSVYYYNSKSEYKVLKNQAVIDENYIKSCKKYSENILEISNDIIVYNLIETEGDKISN